MRKPKDDQRPWWENEEPEPDPHPDAPIIERVVNNRTFLLGLDELYRNAMKGHEREELLSCAQRVASTLKVPPADVPIEGYYVEDEELTSYFRLMRALQQVPLGRASEVNSLAEFSRLLEVTSSPIYGRATRTFLLPTGNDPLSGALEVEDEWTVPTLAATATRIAVDTDDYSLAGLGARAGDPVVLAALRESVVLYATIITKEFESVTRPPVFRYVWRVDPDLAAAAQRFVDAFNGLFGRELPPPVEKYAHIFWRESEEADVVGRCVRLGQTPEPHQRYYHWAVIQGPDDQLGVREFWDAEIWTTERYRKTEGLGGDLPGPTAFLDT